MKTPTQLDAEIAEALAGFNKYRDLPTDADRGNPLHAWGVIHANKLGTYWTVAVDVPLSELAVFRPVVQSTTRLKSVTSARKLGKPLPPIEIGVYRNGSGWLVDGNHRLIDARKAGLPRVSAIFTFVGT
jgi:hypothetical protein